SHHRIGRLRRTPRPTFASLLGPFGSSVHRLVRPFGLPRFHCEAAFQGPWPATTTVRRVRRENRAESAAPRRNGSWLHEFYSGASALLHIGNARLRRGNRPSRSWQKAFRP